MLKGVDQTSAHTPKVQRIGPLLKYLEGAITGKDKLNDGVKGVNARVASHGWISNHAYETARDHDTHNHQTIEQFTR